MNKYQEALDSVKAVCKDFEDLGYISYVTDSDIENLKELVDKETPMKPLEDNYLGEFMCECGSPITKDYKYCPNCGQKLNWNKKGRRMKKPKYSVTIREICPYNFNRISNCEEVWYQGIEIHWSCEHIGYGVLTIDITKDGKYEFDTENMGLEFTNAVLKAYNSYLLKKAKDYFAAELEKLEKGGN